MSEVIGDLSELTANTVTFTATHVLRGSTGTINFKLTEARGLSPYLSPYARVELVGGLSCQVSGPPSADKAIVVTLAVIKDDFTPLPTVAEDILTIAGSTQVSNSIYQDASARPLTFAAEVAHLWKPVPFIGGLPRVVGHFTLPGAEAGSTAILQISGTLRLSGVGFVQTW